MILTSAQKNEVTELAITMFGAAPGGYKTFLEELYVSNGASIGATATALSTQPAFASLYSGSFASIKATMLENLSVNNATLASSGFTMSDADNFLNGLLGSTSPSPADIAAAYVTALDLIATTTALSDVQAVLDTKIAIANAFTAGNGANVTDLDVLMAQMDGITVNTPIPAYASLTVEQDNVFGNSADNVIKAFLSTDTNTLQSGDYINGGAGVDTLNAVIANTPFSIAPETVSVEKLYVQSQASGQGDGDNEVDNSVGYGTTYKDVSALADALAANPGVALADLMGVAPLAGAAYTAALASNSPADAAADPTVTGATDYALGMAALTAVVVADSAIIAANSNVVEFDSVNNTIDAQFMDGTNEFWSTNSRADLVIEDVRNNSHETKIGWQAADPGDVDYAVFYSPTYITKPSGEVAGAQLFLELLDLRSMDLNEGPLTYNPYVGVVIEVDGVPVSIVAPTAITSTYQDVVDALNLSLAGGPYSTITASLGVEFDKVHGGTSVSYTGTTIVLTNTGPETLESVGWTLGGNVLPPLTNVWTNITNEIPTLEPYLTQTDITLDWVGRGSKAGDFIAGSMSTGDNSNSPGIEQFNVEVDRNSWLDSMQSTNNTLEVVNVVNIGMKGSLQLDKLNDVRVFDAAGMEGDVTLTANLSAAITDKYLDLTDTAGEQTADNSDLGYATVIDREFSYDLGKGDDTLNLTVDASNLVDQGTLTREDFKLEITGGDGDDMLSFSVVEDGAYAASGTPWFANHEAYVDSTNLFDKSNIKITAGAGNDVVKTTGAGSFDITTGSGNDTIYTDNAGAKAQWIVNATSFTPGLDPSDIISDPLVDQLLYKATLTVTFSGASTLIQGGVTVGAAAMTDNGFESSVIIPTGTDYLGSQAEVNQAIKAAINNDAVLSKLLIAQDGPANTLVINSLVDGEFDPADLEFTITAPDITPVTGDLTASELLGYQAAYEDFVSNSGLTLTQPLVNTGASNALAEPGYGAPAASFAGTGSTFENNNIIEGGTGDDLTVLSTEENSNEVLVFNGLFGNDTVFNFDDTAGLGAGGDILDFTSHLNNFTYVGGSTSAASQIDAATTVSNTTAVSVGANDFAILTGVAFTAANSWANLTDINFLEAINGTTAYAGMTTTTATAAVTATLVGNLSNSIVFVENAGVNSNDGEYKVFALVSDSTTAADFESATLLGTIDFGDSLAATVNIA